MGQRGKGPSPVVAFNTVSKCKCGINIGGGTLDSRRMCAPETALRLIRNKPGGAGHMLLVLSFQVLLRTWKHVYWPGDPALGGKLPRGN